MNKKNNFVTAVIAGTFFFSLNANAQHIGSPIGFASVPDYGVTTITGGKGGEVVVINGQDDAKKLQDALDSDDKPRIIYIKGAVQMPQYPDGVGPVSDETMRMSLVRSNKTILGLGKDAKIVKSGLSIYTPSGPDKNGSGEGNPQPEGVNNIIIQNLTFEAAPDDGLNIQGGSHHIWIDHCTFTDGSGGHLNNDGQLDYKRGSDYLTVSYCLFTNHGKMSLIGHSNDPEMKGIDQGHLRATYYKNFFNDFGGSASSRHPRVRWGIVHVLNCFIQGVGNDKSTEGVVSQCEAKVFIEGCHFRFAKYGGSVNEHSKGNETDGLIEEKNNTNDQCSKTFSFIKGKSFNTSEFFKYNYSAGKSSDLPTSLPGEAGAGKLNITQVPIENYRVSSSNFNPYKIVNVKGDFILFSGPVLMNENTFANISDLSGRTVIRNRKLFTGDKGYSVSVDDLTPGTYMLSTSENYVIGKFNKR